MGQLHHPQQKKETSFEYLIIDFLTNQWQTLVGICLLAIVISAAVVGYRYYERTQEKNAEEQLFTLTKALQDKTSQVDKAYQDKVAANAKDTAKKPANKKSKNGKKVADAPKPPPPQEKNPQILAQDFGDILNQFDSFISSHHGRKAAYMAAIQAATISEDYKDYPRAEKVLKSVASDLRPRDLFFGLVKGQLATILIDENKCSDAVPVLKEIAGDKSTPFFQAQALLRLGACYINIKNYDEAESALVKVQTDFPQTAAAFQAKDLKRLIMLKRGQKS